MMFFFIFNTSFELFSCCFSDVLCCFSDFTLMVFIANPFTHEFRYNSVYGSSVGALPVQQLKKEDLDHFFKLWKKHLPDIEPPSTDSILAWFELMVIQMRIPLRFVGGSLYLRYNSALSTLKNLFMVASNFLPGNCNFYPVANISANDSLIFEWILNSKQKKIAFFLLLDLFRPYLSVNHRLLSKHTYLKTGLEQTVITQKLHLKRCISFLKKELEQ